MQARHRPASELHLAHGRQAEEGQARLLGDGYRRGRQHRSIGRELQGEGEAGEEAPPPPLSLATAARMASAAARASSSASYFRRGQKKPRRPSLRFRGTTWT